MNAAIQAIQSAQLNTFEHPKGLTPHIVLVASLLYMMSTDGDLAPEEISRLQESVGLDKEAIPKARAYIKKNKFDTFLMDSKEVLDKPSQICILANVYECMLADGVIQKAETKLFQKIQKAYGFSDKTFHKIGSVLDEKNKHEVLGKYDSQAAKRLELTPHLILAASILYMMSADGEVSEEEIGQLSAVINPYEGLQTAAMSYVDQFNLGEFIAGAQNRLNPEQKKYLLLNVCDSMLADGVAEPREVAIFHQFLEVFGFSEHAFKPFYSVIHIKNVKPFESFDSAAQEAQGLFKNIINDEHGGFKVIGSDQQSQNDKLMHERIIEDDEDGEKIRRTMSENTKSVNEGFASTENILKVANSELSKPAGEPIAQKRPELNLQKATDNAQAENIQKIDDKDRLKNLQKSSSDQTNQNTQKISSIQSLENIQSITSDKSKDNKQKLHQDESKDNKQKLHQDESKDNHQQLKAESFEGNVQTLQVSSSSENIAHLSNSSSASNLQEIENQSNEINVQRIEGDAVAENKLALDSKISTENTQTIDALEQGLNKQKITNSQNGDNKAKLKVSSTDTNSQSVKNQEADSHTITIEGQPTSFNQVKISSPSRTDNTSKSLQERIKDNNQAIENHVLANLVQETKSASSLERFKNLTDQLQNINEKLNQVESINRDLPIPMQAIVDRTEKQLARQQSSNQVPVSREDAKDDFFNEPSVDDSNERHPSFSLKNQHEDMALDDSTLNDRFKGALKNDFQDDFKGDFKGDVKDELKNDFTDDFKDDFKGDVKDELKDDFTDDFRDNFTVDFTEDANNEIKKNVKAEVKMKPQNVLNIKKHTPLESLSNSDDSSVLFASITPNTGALSLDSLGTNASPNKSLGFLDESLLLLQIKGAKRSSVTPQQPHRTSQRTTEISQSVYKYIRLSMVFLFVFSWHFYPVTSCDMVSCSWSQIGSPVRLDLKPEVIPPSIWIPMSVASAVQTHEHI